MKTGEAYIGSREQRAFDVLAASVIGLAGAPISGAAAAALCLQRRNRSPFFYQYRRGRDGNTLVIPKIKTLDIEDMFGELETAAAEDPRATKLGRFIRRTGIDELPQVSLVLRGDINMVGIRPQVERVLEQRRKLDPPLFDDWYYCYERRLGILGAGQNYAHEIGSYKEDSVLVREVMALDINDYQQASLASDAGYVAGLPSEIMKLIMIKAQEAAGTRVVV